MRQRSDFNVVVLSLGNYSNGTILVERGEKNPCKLVPFHRSMYFYYTSTIGKTNVMIDDSLLLPSKYAMVILIADTDSGVHGLLLDSCRTEE